MEVKVRDRISGSAREAEAVVGSCVCREAIRSGREWCAGERYAVGEVKRRLANAYCESVIVAVARACYFSLLLEFDEGLGFEELVVEAELLLELGDRLRVEVLLAGLRELSLCLAAEASAENAHESHLTSAWDARRAVCSKQPRKSNRFKYFNNAISTSFLTIILILPNARGKLASPLGFVFRGYSATKQ